MDVVSTVVFNVKVGKLIVDNGITRFLPTDAEFDFKDDVAQIINDLLLCFRQDEQLLTKLVHNVGKIHQQILTWSHGKNNFFVDIASQEFVVLFLWFVKAVLLDYEMENQLDNWDDELKPKAKVIYFMQWANCGQTFQVHMSEKYQQIVSLIQVVEKSFHTGVPIPPLAGNMPLNMHAYRIVAKGHMSSEFFKLVPECNDEAFNQCIWNHMFH